VIDGLKPYTEYKESGQVWLGDIPKHWEILPNRAIFEEVKERGHPDEEMLSVTIKQGVILQKTLLSDTSKKDASNQNKSAYKLVLPGYIAYNKMRAWQGAVGVSNFLGIVSPAYVVLRLRGTNKPRYFHYLFRTPHFAKEAERWSYGITSDMWSLRPEHFKMIYTLLPPKDEQSAIVRLLDHMTRRLNRVIRAKQKVIALLNEQKQVIIQSAVTRGVDPNVRLKPSDLPWLGDIPAHWRVLRAKYVFREVDERSSTGTEELLSVSHITGITPRSEKQITMFKALSYIGHKLCQPGDLVIYTMWAWMAALGVSNRTGIVSPSYAVYRPRNPEQLVGEYIDHLLRVRPFIFEYICRSTGIRLSRLRLYPEYFFKIPVVIPPVEEQQKIALIISSETRDLCNAINETERQITLLQEFRTRLIADVVTGKLDVREAATQLPVETEEGQPDMDATDTIEDESQESVTVGEAYG
jgi:type I restriction enzyme, S subunit